MTPPLRVISLGAGVQSSAMLMLALAGELDADAAIFADTGWEPRAVYAHLDRIEARASAAGFPVYRVRAEGSIRTVGDFGKGSGLDLPFFLKTETSDGFARRQCTSKFKIGPIRRKVRELMAESGARRVDQLMGISIDEPQRMRTSDVKYITNVYPLVEREWRRGDCLRYLAGLDIDAPRSACIGCPFHSDSEWRRLRAEAPDEFADAVAFEREVQEHGGKLDAIPYLHRQRVPLDLVDLSTPEDHGQLSLDGGTWVDDCSGVCGV